MTEGLDAARRSLVISEIRSIAGGQVFGEPEPALVAAAERLSRWSSLAGWAMVAVCAAAGLIALLATRRRIQPGFRARHRVQRILPGLLIVCAVVALVPTLGIVASLPFRAFRFFALVTLGAVPFGLTWAPPPPPRA